MLRKLYLISILLLCSIGAYSQLDLELRATQSLDASKDSIRVLIEIRRIGIADDLGSSNFWLRPNVDSTAPDLDIDNARLDPTGGAWHNVGGYDPMTISRNTLLNVVGINVVKSLTPGAAVQVPLTYTTVGTIVIPILDKCDSSVLSWRTNPPTGTILTFTGGVASVSARNIAPSNFFYKDSIGATLYTVKDSICDGDSIPIGIRVTGEADTVAGGFTVVLNPGGFVFNNVKGTDTLMMPPRPAGIQYTDYAVVSVTDSNGCTHTIPANHFTSTVDLFVKNQIPLTLTVDDPGPYCWDEVQDFYVLPISSPTDSLIWSHTLANGNLAVGNQDTVTYTFTNIATGPDKIFARKIDDDGCEAQDSLSIQINDPRIVINTADDPDSCGCLSVAAAYANSNLGADTIRFDPVMTGQTVVLGNELIVSAGNGNGTVIDGDIDGDDIPSVSIDGGAVSKMRADGDNITFQYLHLFNFVSAIWVEGANAVAIGNRIGTNLAGTAVAASANIEGVNITSLATNCRIGGTTPAERNIISGNSDDGIEIEGVGVHFVIGNYIGLNASGNAAIPNGVNGVFIDGSANNSIGDGTPSGLNVISGNGDSDIRISGGAGQGNQILGNYIGTDNLGNATVANAAYGIRVDGGASNNQIGDGTAGGRNYIGGHGTYEISLESGSANDVKNNSIGISTGGTPLAGSTAGINLSGTAQNDSIIANDIANSANEGIGVRGSADDNRFFENQIYSNGGLGIDFVDPGVQNDIDSPVINDLNPVGTILEGTSQPNARIQVFADAAEEGEQYLGDTVATAGGNWEFDLNLGGINPGLTNLTAIQDDGDRSSDFSAPFAICSRPDINFLNTVVSLPHDSIYNCSTRDTVVRVDSATVAGTILGSNGLLFEWYDGGRTDPVLVGQTKSFISVNPASSQFYTVRVSDFDDPSCFEYDSVWIEAEPLPVVTITEQSSGPYCENGFAILSEDSLDGETFQWLINGNPIAGATTDTLYADSIGTHLYNVVVTTPFGCTDTALVGTTITINANPSVGIDQGSNQIVCISGGLFGMSSTVLPANPGTWSWKQIVGSSSLINISTNTADYDPSVEIVGFVDTVWAIFQETATTCWDSAFIEITVDGGLAVSKTVDDNTCGTFRNAIREANLTPGSIISFSIPGGGPHEIVLDSALPNVTGANTLIDGWSQPGYDNDGIPDIQLDGQGGSFSGIVLDASGVAVRGLAIINFLGGNAGIETLTGTNDSIYGNFIGIDTLGNAAANDIGIRLNGLNHVVGDTLPNRRNIISSNTNNGIFVNANNNFFFRNWIGVGIDAFTPRANGAAGILLNGAGASLNTFGSFNTDTSNIIANNLGPGIEANSGGIAQNAWRNNSIYDNAVEGISLIGDVQSGIAAPTIDSLGITGILYGKDASLGAIVSLFADGSEQGRQFLDTTIVANAGGFWSKQINPGAIIAGLDSLTVTQESGGNSSEFADPVLVCFEPVISYLNPPTNDTIVYCLGSDTLVYADSVSIDPTFTFSYSWNVGSPGGLQISNSATALITNTGPEIYFLTVTRSPGCFSVDSFYVDTLPTVTPADAGTDIDSCGTLIRMTANAPTFGAGTWTQISGPLTINIVDPLSDTTIVDLVGGFTQSSDTFELEWTIIGDCDTSSDIVQIVFHDSPSPPDAGPDIDSCGTTAFLSGTPIGTGLGYWTATGPSTLFFFGNDTTDPNVRVDVAGIVSSPDTFSVFWNSQNGTCPESQDVMQLVFFGDPTVPNAGTPDSVCQLTTTLAGNMPAAGEYGYWQVVSGPAGHVFVDSTVFNTDFTAGGFGVYELSWSLGNGVCLDSADTVQITFFDDPTVPNAGTPDSVCQLTTTLAGNMPAAGEYGYWQVVSGPAGHVFVDSTVFNTDFTAGGFGVYELSWSLGNGVCLDSADTVQITFFDDPTVPNAGTPDSVCQLTTTLAGNMPAAGEYGYWQVVSGPAGHVFVDSTVFNTDFTAGGFGVYELSWSLGNGVCLDSADTVQITFFDDPTIPNAGTPDSVCQLTTTLAGNMPAAGEYGYWQVVSGPAGHVFVDSTVFNTDFTAGGFGVYELSWSLGNGVCLDSADTVQITFFDDPTIPNAGTPDSVCQLTTTLAGNMPGPAEYGYWQVVSGPAGHVFVDSTVFNTDFTAGGFGVYELSWSLGNGVCLDSADTVQITFFDDPTIPNAGTPDSVCQLTTTLAGNMPGPAEYGYWQVVSGPAGHVFVDSTVFNTDFTAGGFGVYELSWSLGNGVCLDSADTVQITFFDDPTIPNAGTPDSVCQLTTTLAGNMPGPAEYGYWQVVSGPAGHVFVDSTVFNTDFTAGGFGVYELSWSLGNGVCLDSADTVQITFFDDPTIPNAGTPDSVCQLTTTLAGNMPAAGEYGYWQVVSGPAGHVFVDSTVFNTDFTAGGFGVYELSWSLGNGVCLDSADTVQITFFDDPTIPNAGTPDSVCQLTTTLAGNMPAAGEYGYWQVVSGPAGHVFVDSTVFNTDFTAGGFGVYELSWSLGNGVCLDSADTVQITFFDFATVPNAGMNDTVCGLTATLGANPAGAGEYGYWQVLSGPAGHAFVDSTVFNTDFTGGNYGLYELSWSIGNGVCLDSADTVFVRFDQDPTTSNAGSDTSLCGTNYTMDGNTPTVGIGVWDTISTPPGPNDITFFFPNDPNTPITASDFGVYLVTWTITNGNCTPSIDTVELSFFDNPSTADAGPDPDSACGFSTALQAVPPTIGSGIWTADIVGNPGNANFSNDSLNPAATVNVDAYGVYKFYWTVSNGPCTPSVDSVIFEFFEQPDTAIAGADDSICGLVYNLMGNTPSAGTTQWSQISGPGIITFGDSSLPNTTATASVFGVYEIEWRVTNGACVDRADTVEITYFDIATVPNAGTPDSVCQLTTTLAGNMPAAGEYGYWQVVSGPAGHVFVDSTVFNTDFTAGGFGVYELSWSLGNGVCLDSADTVQITFFDDPTVPNAGTPDSVCQLTTTLAGNMPAAGEYGYWQVVSGPAGHVFVDSTVFNTDFTAGGFGVYELSWSLGNGVCLDSADTVQITFFDDPTVPNAGTPDSVCQLTTTLAGNMPAAGEYGYWQVVSGPAGHVFVDSTVFNTDFTAGGFGVYELSWSLGNGVCLDSADTVQITFFDDPTVPNAGTPDSVCQLTTTLAGNMPAAGEYGYWQVVSGPAGHVFVDSTVFNTDFTAGGFGVYELSWSLGNGVCLDSADTVQITFFDDPTVPNAGTPDSVCQLTTTLAGNMPAAGEYGYWQVVSGPAGHVFVDSTVFNTDFTAGGFGVYELSWSLGNGVCLDSADTVQITFFDNPTPAFAGNDTSVCGDTVGLNADIVTVGSGMWSFVSGPAVVTFDNPADPKSEAYGSTDGNYILMWTTSNGNCPVDQDSVTVGFRDRVLIPVFAGPDQSVCDTFTTLAASNPGPFSSFWTEHPVSGNINFVNGNSPTSVVHTTGPGLYGTYKLSWTVANDPCPSVGDTVLITFDEDPTTSVAGAVTDSICADTVELAANNPIVGTGQWTTTLAPAGGVITFDDDTLFNTIARHNGVYGQYQLTWTISSGSCTPSASSITVDFFADPTIPDAGPDSAEICSNSIVLSANNITSGQGRWKDISAIPRVSFNDPTLPNATASVVFTGTEDTVEVLLEWKSFNGSCDTLRDQILVWFFANPTTANAGGDQLGLCGDSAILAANNPDPGVGNGVWTWQSGPGQVTFSDSSQFNSSAYSNGFLGTHTLRWTISNGTCADSFDEMDVEFFDPVDSANLTGGAVICEGDSIPLVVNFVGGAGPYLITIVADIGANPVVPSPYTSGDTIWHVPTNPALTTYTLVSATTSTPPFCAATVITSNATSLVNPTAAANMTPLNQSICDGSSANIQVNFTTGTAPYFVRYTDGTNTTDIFPYTSGDNIVVNPTVNTTYYIDSISDANGCGVAAPDANITDSAEVLVNPNVPPTVSLVQDPPGSVCDGELVDFTVVATDTGNAPVWAWTVNGGPIVSTGNSYSYSPTDGDLVRVTLDVTGMGCIPAPAGIVEDTTLMIVVDSITPVVSIDQFPANPVCATDDLLLVANITGAGPSDTYAWRRNGGAVIGTDDSLTVLSTNWNDGDEFSFTLTTTAACATVGSVTDQVTINTTTGGTTTVSIVQSPASPVCINDPVQFEASNVGGGANPVYEWFIDNNPAGTDSTIFDTTFTPAGSYYVKVRMSKAPSCYSPDVVLDSVLVVVDNSVTPSISISANPNGPVCPNEDVEFEAIMVGQGTAVPTWYLGTNPVAFGTSYLYPGNTVSGDSISVQLNSNASCKSSGAIVNDSYIIQIQDPITPEVSISQSPDNPVCIGDDVDFTANPSGGGTSPSYQWFLNGGLQAQGTGLDNVTFVNIQDGDEVAVIMTSSNPPGCASMPTAADTIFIQGSLTVPLQVSIDQSPSGDLCIGQTVTYTANVIGGGANPSYQWNVIPPAGPPISNLDQITLTTVAGAPSNSFEIGPGTNLITLNLTADPNSCNTGQSFLAFQSTTVDPVVTPSVSLAQSPANPVCSGDNVTFSTTVSGEGTSPVYNWFVNGGLVATNSSGTYNSNMLADGDEVVVELVSNGCGAVPTDRDTLVIDLQDPIIPTVDIEVTPGTEICSGSLVRLVALSTGEGDNPSYAWRENGTFFGNGDTIIRSFTGAGPFFISVELNKGLACGAGTATAIDFDTITINNTPSVTITQDPDPTCNGDLTNLSANVVGLGFGSQYVWRRISPSVQLVAAGADLTSIQTGVNAGETYRVTVTNASSGCLAPTDSVFFTYGVNTLPGSVTPEVFLSMDPMNPICPDELITFEVDSVRGQGANPGYRWYVNDTLRHIGTTYATNELKGFDVVSLELNSSASCATQTFAYDSITILETDPSVLIVGDTTFCYGDTAVTFFAQDSSGGVSFTWIEAISGQIVGTADSLRVDTAGNYYLKVDNGRGCADSSRAIIVETPLPFADSTVAAVADTCFGETITLSLVGPSVAADYNLTWMYGNDTIAGANDSTYEAGWTGVYQILAANASCIDTMGYAQVSIKPRIDSLLSIRLGDSILCKDDSVLLWVPGVQGHAAGSRAGYINTGINGLGGPGSKSVEAWVKTDTAMGIISWGTGGTNNWIVRINGANGALELSLNQAGNNRITGTTDLRDYQYHHIAVVYDSAINTNLDGVTLYVDGQKEMAGVFNNTAVSPGANTIYMGLRSQGPGANPYFMTGLIDEVRIWDYAMDSISIAHNRNTPLRGTEPNLFALWNFEDTTGSTPKEVVTGFAGGSFVNSFFGIDSGYYRAPLSNPGYVWRVDGTIQPLFTSNFFVYDTTGDVTVEVSNGNCAATSNVLPLREVIIDTTLNLLLGSGSPIAVGCFGDSVAFESNEIGPPAVTYQWFYGWDTIPGATSRDFGSTKTGIYTVAITKEECTEPSRSQVIRNAPQFDDSVRYETDTICEDGSVELVINSVNTNYWSTTGAGYGEANNLLDLVPDNGFSVELFFKIDNLASLANSVLMMKNQDANDYFRIAFDVNGDIMFETDVAANGAGTDQLILTGSNGNWNTSDWFHVAVSWDNIRGKAIHVVGVGSAYDSTENIVMPDFTPGPACDLVVGIDQNFGCATLPASEFPGSIDEVRFWENAHPRVFFANNSLVPLSGTEHGLLALWQMDSVGIFDDGDLIGDATSNSFNLELKNNGHVFAKGGFYQPDNAPSYQWYDDNGIIVGANTDTLVVTTEGNYYAEVLNGLNPATCAQFTDTVGIKVNFLDDSLIFDLVHDTVFCDDTDSALISIDNNQGPELRVDWYDTVGNTLIAADTHQVWIDTTGVYYAVLTKSYTTFPQFGGNVITCTDTTRLFHVIELENPMAFAGYDTLICFDQAHTLGGIVPDSVTASGGNPPYTYSWTLSTGLDDDGLLSDTNAANPIFSGDTVNTFNFIVEVTDDSLCFDIDTVMVQVNPEIIPFAGNDTIICFEDSAVLGGTPTAMGGSGNINLTPIWRPTTYFDDPADSTSFNPLVINSIDVGDDVTYVVEITDTVAGCQVYDTVRIVYNPKVVANAVAPDSIVCFMDSLQLDVQPRDSGGIGMHSYQWESNPVIAGIFSPSDTIADPYFKGIQSGLYQVYLTGTDSIGCIGRDTIQMRVNDTIMVDAGVDTVVCYGDTMILGGLPTASGGQGAFKYQWTYIPNFPGLINSGDSANPILIHNVTPLPGPVDVTFTLTVYDTASMQICEVVDQVVIRLNPQISISSFPGDSTVICFEDTIQPIPANVVGGSGNFSYLWSPNTYLNDDTLLQPDFYGDSSGVHLLTLSVTDDMDPFMASCIVDSVIQIRVRDTLMVNARSIDLLGNADSIACFQDSLLLIADVISDEGPFTYTWTPGTNLGGTLLNDTATMDGIIAGLYDYVIRVQDNGFLCDNFDTVHIAVSNRIIADANRLTAPGVFDTLYLCYGQDSSLGGNPTGNNLPGIPGGPLSYTWTPNIKLDDASLANPALTADSAMRLQYNVVVSDSFGCTDEDSLFVFVNDSISAGLINDTTLCFGDSIYLGDTLYDGSVTVTGGTEPYTFVWSSIPSTSVNFLDDPNARNPLFNPLGNANQIPHQFSVTIRDSLGICVEVRTVTITVNPPITFDPNAIVDSLCQFSTVQMGGFFTAGGGFDGTFDFQWAPSGLFDDDTLQFPNFTANYIGDTMVYLTVTDPIGCVAIDSQFVRSLQLPSFNIQNDSFDMCFGLDTVLRITDTVNYQSYGMLDILWSNGKTTDTIHYRASTDTIFYIALTNNQNTCSSMDSVQVFVNPLPLQNFSTDGSSISLNDTLAYCPASPSNPLVNVHSVPDAGNPIGIDTFFWSALDPPGFIAPGAELLNPTTYLPGAGNSPSNLALKIRDFNDCVNYDTVTILLTQYPNVRIRLADDTVCYGDSTSLYLVNLPAGPTFNHTVFRVQPGPFSIFIYNGGLDSIGILSSQSLPDTLTKPLEIVYEWTFVEGTCNSILYDTLIVLPKPKLTSGAVPNPVCLGDTTELSASINAPLVADSFYWSTGTVNTNGIEPVVPLVDTDYQVVGLATMGVLRIRQPSV